MPTSKDCGKSSTVIIKCVYQRRLVSYHNVYEGLRAETKRIYIYTGKSSYPIASQKAANDCSTLYTSRK